MLQDSTSASFGATLATQFSDQACAELTSRQGRFVEECEIMASVHSRYVPAIYDQGQVTVKENDAQSSVVSENWPYCIMEWIDGPRLEDFLTGPEGPWPRKNEDADGPQRGFDQLPAEWQKLLLDVFTEIARGLRDAHGQGIVHLDVTSRNVLMKGGRDVKLIDWGLARQFSPECHGQAGMAAKGAGSPDYMAPEQVRGSGGRQLAFPPTCTHLEVSATSY